MISEEANNFIAYQYRELSQSGLTAPELADRMQELLRLSRTEKSASQAAPASNLRTLPLGGKRYLALVQ